MSEIPQDRPDDRWEPAAQPPPAPQAEPDRPSRDGEQNQPSTGTPHGQASPQGQGAPAWSGSSYGTPYAGGPPRHEPDGGSPTPTSAVVLLVLGGLGLLVFVWTGVGIVWAAPVVLAILAMVQRADVPRSQRLLKIGWIVYAVLAALTVVLISLVVAALTIFVNGQPSFGDGPYDPNTIAFATGWLGAR